MAAYTYILKCNDDTLYTGWTNDLTKRLLSHNSGKGSKYTAPRRPVVLAYYEEFSSKEEAMKREYAIKQLSRNEKLELIASNDNPVNIAGIKEKNTNPSKKILENSETETKNSPLVLYVSEDVDINYAKEIADKIQIKIVKSISNESLYLNLNKDGLSLTDGTLSYMGDFHSLDKRLKLNNLNQEFLIKAAKIKGTDSSLLTVLDATAGMGEDSFILAAYGFKVIMFEQDKIIAALLYDSLKRALTDDCLKEIAQRITLVCRDSIEAMTKKDYKADIILLDPMFPKREKSGLIKKKFQLLQKLEKPCDNETALMEAALNAGAKKIIVKRPAKGPCLAGKKPDYPLLGKAIRYDCYINL